MSQFAFLTFQSHKKWPGNLSDQSATLLKCLAELSIARSDVEGRSHFIVLPSGHVKIGIFQMAISFVDLPIENGDFPSFFVCLPGRVIWGFGFFSLSDLIWDDLTGCVSCGLASGSTLVSWCGARTADGWFFYLKKPLDADFTIGQNNA